MILIGNDAVFQFLGEVWSRAECRTRYKENVRLRSSFKYKEPWSGGALNKSTFHHRMTGELLSRFRHFIFSILPLLPPIQKGHQKNRANKSFNTKIVSCSYYNNIPQIFFWVDIKCVRDWDQAGPGSCWDWKIVRKENCLRQHEWGKKLPGHD